MHFLLVMALFALRPELRPLEFVVGSCWTGTFPNSKTTDTHCFEPALGGQFIRDRHVVRGAKGPYSGETMYAWDPGTKQITYMYWATNGATSKGTAISEPPSVVFPETHSSGSEMKSVWTPRGADAYDVVVSRKNDGEWVESWRMTLTRDTNAEIERVMQDYVTAWKRGDEAGVLRLFTSDAVLMPHHGGKPVVGLEAIRKFWFSTPTQITLFDRTTDEIRRDGDLAYARGAFDLAWQGGRNKGTYVTILRREPSGWKIALQMWDDPPLQ